MHHANCHSVSSCATCAATALTRNHYFTGKLMVERDFTDEQRYFLERLRLHNQRLHGTGVACGLEIEQHDNPACQDRYVYLEPGSAIDCCGHDILVPDKDTIDIKAFPAVKALFDKPDGKDHVLQFCICYRDCPTEEIPVLYDECGCDDSQCAPNRILESYSIDVKVDPPPTTSTFGYPALSREGTIGVVNPLFIALDAAGNRIFVIGGLTGAQAVYQINTSTQAVEASASLGQQPLGMIISPDGKRLCVFVVGTLPATDREIWIFDTSGPATLASAPIDKASIAGSGPNFPSLAVSKDGEVLAGFAGFGLGAKPQIYAWKSGAHANAPTAAITLNFTGDVGGIACSSDGKRAWVTSGARLTTLDLTAANLSPQTVTVPGTNLFAVSVVVTSAPDLLLVTDNSVPKVYLIDPTQPSGTPPIASVDLVNSAVAVAVSPDGSWAYVEVSANPFMVGPNADQIQVVDIGKMRMGVAQTASKPFDVEPGVQGIAITPDGARLYVPFLATTPNGAVGGVAIIDVTNADCLACLHHVCPCPACKHADCVVLATVKQWQPGFRLLDPVNPPPTPADDETNKIARIDNMDGRIILASTQTLQQVIECLADHGIGGGGTGPMGPQGLPGKDGKDGAPGKDGKDGKDGLGLDTRITRINAVSWLHAHTAPNSFVTVVRQSGTKAQGLVIGFTHPVSLVAPGPGTIPSTTYRNILQVLMVDPNAANGLICRCQLEGTVIAVTPTVDWAGTQRVTGATEATSAATATGLAFLPDSFPKFGTNLELWIRLLSEFVVDDWKNPVDGAFVQARFPTGDRRHGTSPSGTTPLDPSDVATIDKLPGIPGEHFESWFIVRA